MQEFSLKTVKSLALVFLALTCFNSTEAHHLCNLFSSKYIDTSSLHKLQN